jgi:hypothetical protein
LKSYDPSALKVEHTALWILPFEIAATILIAVLLRRANKRQKEAEDDHGEDKPRRRINFKVIYEPFRDLDAVAVFTFVLAVVSVLQWRALISTDDATHKLADAALKQAKSLEIQVGALRANLRREQIQFQPIGEDQKIVGSGEQLFGWNVNPIWSNVGATDARNFISWWELTPVQRVTPVKPSDCPTPTDQRGHAVPSIVSPGQQKIEQAKILPIGDAIKAGPKRLHSK